MLEESLPTKRNTERTWMCLCWCMCRACVYSVWANMFYVLHTYSKLAFYCSVTLINDFTSLSSRFRMLMIPYKVFLWLFWSAAQRKRENGTVETNKHEHHMYTLEIQCCCTLYCYTSLNMQSLVIQGNSVCVCVFVSTHLYIWWTTYIRRNLHLPSANISFLNNSQTSTRPLALSLSLC